MKMECRLNITAGYKEGKSYIKDLYVGTPFRVVSVGQRKRDNKLYQMIMSTSPGILDGDQYIIGISLEEQSRLQLASQSYQRLFDMENKATQNLTVDIGDHAFFAFVPHPVVPHENSNFESRAKITLGKESSVLISEIITCGRKHYGEVFKLKKFHNLTEVFHEGKLIVKDNVLIEPGRIPIQNIGILEDFTHQGSLIFVSTKKDTDKTELVNHLVEKSKDFPEVEIGISALESGGFVLRALSHGAEVMYNYFLAVQDFLWEENILTP